MKSNQQALQELAQAELQKPYFDEQFMIYRYKRLIEFEMFESTTAVKGKQENIGSLANEITVEGYVKNIQARIEQATLQNLDFWQQLKEDTPDLMKLSDVGTQINHSLQSLETSWNRLVRKDLDIPTNIMRTYAKFLLDVINDKEAAAVIIKKLQVTAQQNQLKGRNCNNLNQFQDEQTGLISISGEDVKKNSLLILMR